MERNIVLLQVKEEGWKTTQRTERGCKDRKSRWGGSPPLSNVTTVWPEILAGRYFGGLLKICHLAEFTLAVEPGLAIMIFITKWLLKRAGILIGP